MTQTNRAGVFLPGTLMLCLLVGCATTVPKPSDQLDASEAAVSAAQGAGARDAAPVLLNSAKDKLSNARDAIGKKHYKQATWLLEDAEADAELAKAKAETAKTKKAADELEKNIDSLHQQLDNSSS